MRGGFLMFWLGLGIGAAVVLGVVGYLLYKVISDIVDDSPWRQ